MGRKVREKSRRTSRCLPGAGRLCCSLGWPRWRLSTGGVGLPPCQPGPQGPSIGSSGSEVSSSLLQVAQSSWEHQGMACISVKWVGCLLSTSQLANLFRSCCVLHPPSVFSPTHSQVAHFPNYLSPERQTVITNSHFLWPFTLSLEF